MALKQELITRLIIALGLIFIAGKILGPLLRLFWESLTGGRQKNHTDLDILIERQKQLMRKGPSKPQPSSSLPQPTRGKTIQAYNDRFRELSASGLENKASLEDIKKILSLLDNLQWGEGEDYANIAKKLKKELHIDIPQDSVFKAFQDIIKKDLLLLPDTLPSYDKILTLVETKTVLGKIIQESCQNKGKLLDLIAKNHRLLLQDIVKGVTFLVYAPKKNDHNKRQDQILKGKLVLKQENLTELENNIDLLLRFDHKHFKTKNDLFKDIASSALFFSILSPISPPKDKNDLARALEIFHANDETPLENIKKRYKELASQKHPDKLSALGIPSQFEGMATKNFATLQQAYNIVLEKRNKS